MGNLNPTAVNYNPVHLDLSQSAVLNINSDPSTIHHSLKIFHQNICGLRHKTNELLCSLYPDLPHIICLTEHHLNSIELNSIVIDNYKLGANYCRKNARNGGMCIFLLNCINFVTLNNEADCFDFDIELCTIKIQSGLSFIYILSVYRAPSGNFTNFIHKMDKILRSLCSSKIEFIVCGDFNIDYLTDNSRKSQLNSLLNSYNLFSTVDFPTRIQNLSKSAIDNIFIDYSRLGAFEATPIYDGLSDHDAQLILIHDIMLPSSSKTTAKQEKLTNSH
jgi:exonuclease III